MPTVSLAELQQYVLGRLELNSILYTTPELTNAINEGYRLINIFCWVNQDTVSVPGFSVANQLIYQTPSPIIFPLVAHFEGRQLGKSSFGSLTRTYLNWATSTTAKNGPVRDWSPIGINQFIIHPADSLGGRDITVTGVVEPALLAAPGDVISIEDEFITMIIEYASHRLQIKEGGRAFAYSSTMLQTFYRKLKEHTKFSQTKFPRYFILTGTSQ